MLLFQQIEDLAYKHTDARRTIGEFLLAKKSRVREYNMQQIAEETFSSKSSLCKGTGLLRLEGVHGAVPERQLLRGKPLHRH